MTRYDNMKFMGYDSEEEMDEAERRLEEIARKRINAEKESKIDEKSVGTKMTLDEAIKEQMDFAKINEYNSKSCKDSYSKECYQKYSTERRQVAEWLTELKDLREENKVLMQECDRLIKEKGELLKKTTDVQPIVYANKTVNVGLRSYCSNCGRLTYMENYCTHCGAKVNK